MPKAGPLRRSVSKFVREISIRNNHASTVQAPSSAQSPRPDANLGLKLHSEEMVIGLALGSPRLDFRPDDCDVGVSCVDSSPEELASTLGNTHEIGSGSKGIKRKGSNWKSFGSLFGRREVRSASAFYQLDQKHQWEPAKQLIGQDQLGTNALRRNHGSKAHQVDWSTGMCGEGSRGLPRRSSSRRRGLRRRKVKEPQHGMPRAPVKYEAKAIADDLDLYGEQQESRLPGSSFLEVEIPCVELERYSVMFGDVLRPQAGQSKRQPSLRQARFEDCHRPAPSKPALKKGNAQGQDHFLVLMHSSEDIAETSISHDRRPSVNLSQRSANSTTASFFECAEDPGYESSQPAFPARTSSMRKVASPKPRYRHQGKDRKDAVGPNAEVSVARQISITRRQRQLLAIKPRINHQSTTDESRISHHLTLEDA